MTLAIAGTLLGLALIDSTSFGTLGIPVVMLVQRQVRVRSLLIYLLVISAFYFALGVALLAGATGLRDVLSSAGQSTGFAWAQLVVGVLLFAGSFLVDKRGKRWRTARREARGLPPRESRSARMKAKILGPDASGGAVAGVALIAGLIEAASMIPYLAAIGTLSGADIATLPRIGVLAAYVVVMALPALLLLALRMAARRRVAPLLNRVNEWIERNQADMLGWTLGIVGVLLAINAYQQLQQLGAI